MEYELVTLKELDISKISSICIYHEIRMNVHGDMKLLYSKEFMIDSVDRSFNLELNAMLIQSKLAYDMTRHIPRSISVFVGSIIYTDGTVKYLDVDDIIDIEVETANDIIRIKSNDSE